MNGAAGRDSRPKRPLLDFSQDANACAATVRGAAAGLPGSRLLTAQEARSKNVFTGMERRAAAQWIAALPRFIGRSFPHPAWAGRLSRVPLRSIESAQKRPRADGPSCFAKLRPAAARRCG